MDNNQNMRKDIDLVEILLLLWSKRRRFIFNCFIGSIHSLE